MKLKAVVTVLGIWMSTVAAQGWANEDDVRAFIKLYADAFNEESLETLGKMWTEDAVYMNRETAERTEGREAILGDMKAAFSSAGSIRINGTVDRIRFIRPEVADVRGKMTTSVTDMEPSVANYVAILVKENGGWKIDSVEESAVVLPSTPSDALESLDWLAGSWLDESDESQVISTFRWSSQRTFLVRTVAEQSEGGVAREGTQIIGWDPRSQQIRSWSFNSDGSFGDGIWTQNGDDWLVRSSETMADGRAASGTYIITPGDASFSIRLVGHEIEGESMPASDTVRVVLVPEADPVADASAVGEPVADAEE